MKEPMHKIELELSDVADIKELSPGELKKVPFEKIKLLCSVNGCCRFTSVKDYGISPVYYGFSQWIDLSTIIYFCPKHWREYKAANKNNNIFEYKIGSALNHLK